MGCVLRLIGKGQKIELMKPEDEFTALLRAHKQTIYTVCYMFSDDQDEVEDLFQEVCIHLWQGFPRFRGNSKIDTWVWRVALNTCITYQRRERVHRERNVLDIDLDLFADTSDDGHQIKMLYDRIHQLGLFDRAIILLWLENLSYDEIGEMMGISTKNVSVRLTRIREQLRRMKNNESH